MVVAVKRNLNHQILTLGTATSGKTTIFNFDLRPEPVDAVPKTKIYTVDVVWHPLSIYILKTQIYLWWSRGILALPVLKNGSGKIFVSC